MCTCLTKFYLMVGVYIVFHLHKVQLHVSALDNGHLQVVHEILNNQLYETYVLYTVGRWEVRWARDLVCVMEVGRCGYMAGLCYYMLCLS